MGWAILAHPPNIVLRSSVTLKQYTWWNAYQQQYWTDEPRFKSAHGVLNVLSDLVYKIGQQCGRRSNRQLSLTSRLQTKQIKISEQIVMQRQELKIKFGEGQAPLARVIFGWHHVLIPYHLFRGIQRHFVQQFQLRLSPLVFWDLMGQLPVWNYTLNTLPRVPSGRHRRTSGHPQGHL